MNKKISTLLEKIFKILKIKIIFFVPKNIDTIILDYQTGYFYENFFKNKIILYTRGEKYYLKIFIKSLLKCFVSKKSFNQLYIINCIKEIDPKFLITFTDYNLFFLSLKKLFPEKKMIIFQSHTRSFQTLIETIGPKYKNFNKFNVDYVFVWGERFYDYYNYFINGKIIVAGNVKNNFFKQKKLKNDRKLVLISQFRSNKPKEFHFNSQKTEKFINDYYENIKKFVATKKLKLFIIGNKLDTKGAINEKLFFSDRFGNKFSFLTKNDIFASYKNSNEMNNFVTNSSSLGLELIARGKRVCFINRESPYNDKFKEDIFKIKRKGQNWVNSSNKKNVFKVLDFLMFSKNNFKNIYKNHFKQFLIYDKGNKIIKKELKKIGLII